MNRQEILEEAIKCVTKDRNATHGEPEDNFNTIAAYWNVYLHSTGYRLKGDLNAKDIAAMMILMKMSRIATSPEQPDHWVDIAGYAACGGGIATSQNKEGKFLYCYPSADSTVYRKNAMLAGDFCEQCGGAKERHEKR